MKKIYKGIFKVMALAMLLVLPLTGCGGQQAAGSSKAASSASTAAGKAAANGPLTIKVLNVGQGDATLIQTSAKTVLIDTSDIDERDKLKAELDKAGVKRIDMVILTHPHADHIGGMELLLKQYKIGKIYDNGMPTKSKVYSNYMKLAKEKKVEVAHLAAGDELDLGDGVVFKVYHPFPGEVEKSGKDKNHKYDPNNESIVGKLIFKDFSMLFTGDAEKPVESELLTKYKGDLRCNILKSPHHGSSTASSDALVRSIKPEVATISLGVNNDYGHPHKETIEVYTKHKVDFYRTDVNGTITITSDGNGYQISIEKGSKNDTMRYQHEDKKKGKSKK